MGDKAAEAYNIWNRINRKYYPEYWQKRKQYDAPWETEMAQILVREYQIQSLVDFGCGFGSYIEAMHRMGVKVKGYEYNLESVQDLIDPDIRPLVEKADVTETLDCEGFDCCLSIEVGEHLAPDLERNAQYVKNLIKACQRYIFFTAAPPGQRSPRHINLQPKEYWIKIFEENGAKHNEEETTRLLAAWGQVKCPWYISINLMVFSKTNT